MNYHYIDTHAHLNLAAFKDDRDEVLVRMQEAGVAAINVGTKESTSQLAVEIADEADNCFAIIGLHPIQTTPAYHDEEETGEGNAPFTSKGEVFNPDFYRELVKQEKVVGIGECGFDYHHNGKETYEVQETAFIEQIKLANELQLPLMIHTRNPKPGEKSPTGRDVYEDVYDTLKAHAKVAFNVHFFAGTLTQAKKFIELGGTISFTGVITFKNATEYHEVVREIPLENMHAETDCPYVSPVPYRGQRCEPQYVVEVYKKIAELRREDEEVVRTQLLENARNFYKLH